ncbi:MAG: hypothetical protein PCFJNLEI_01334 [Verrucomicrobiae bacterium]|nr:hypothetical protein [Verrucomicrobiae bacterium]
MRMLTLCLTMATPVVAIALEPFGAGVKVPPRKLTAATATPYRATLDCYSPSVTNRWEVENGTATTPAFQVLTDDGRNALRLLTGALAPGRSTVRILLPGDGAANGDVWTKNRANYVSFLCRSDRAAELTFHLLQRGKSAGTYHTKFSTQPGDWQRVTLPVELFGLKNFAKVAGLGFRVAAGGNAATVTIAEIAVGNSPFTDDSWKSHRLTISLSGEWRFAADAGNQGRAANWFAPTFDDSSWRILKTGQSWQQQGVDHSGWGWYRQQIFVPQEMAGTPLTLRLAEIPADDEVWFNGERIGGITGEYKYRNWITRVYTVPPALVRFGQTNSLALRIWGGHLSFIGKNSGLVKGPLVAEFDPYQIQLRAPGGPAMAAPLFDLSDAQRGQPFEIVFSFPTELTKEPGARLRYRLTDIAGGEILAGQAPLAAGTASVTVTPAQALALYLRGQWRATLVVENAAGEAVYTGLRQVDQLSFAKRDLTPLPALPERFEETPYGKLKLVDEIDCATATMTEPHPYLESGFDHAASHHTPGVTLNVKVVDILGRPARESEYGWFAYRIGRGKLTPRQTYLLRIEYPEDRPRFAPIEIQTGQNYMDVGWKNGVAPDDVYDNWPLSKQWQSYDVIVPLDDETVGTGGTGSAPAANGFWVYFMNKLKPDAYYAMWEGGPAVARLKLYEIDVEKHAPVIHKPQDLPQRVLAFDWERQPDHEPADLVKYAKLMGYSAISPVIIKWFFANYSEPLNGYTTVGVDAQNYWTQKPYDPASGQPATAPDPDRQSPHVRYLEATKQFGLDYIPRFEWGGSQDLPTEARARDATGQFAKPNRFAPWCANLLHPRTWDDLKKLLDHLIKPYVKDNPQLTGAHWRIRCDRLPISYGAADIEMFARETNTPLPPGGYEQRAAWATREMSGRYDEWWHAKRAQFHRQAVELLTSYRPDLKLYYYNWDPDKFGLIEPDITAWAFVSEVVKPPPHGGRAAYERERAVRKSFTAADYIYVMRSGNWGKASKGINRADYGIRPELYRDLPGFQIFAPANYRCYSDLPEYLNYFRTADGVAVSHVVSYDEIGSRTINPKYEGNMITPGGPAFSMALELLPYFHSDARTLNYTVYTYGRGFAAAHRRFAQAFLALPAVEGTVVEQADPDVKIRLYAGKYVGIAYKGDAGKKLTIKLPVTGKLRNLVTGEIVGTEFELTTGPMELHAFVLQ